MVTLAVPLQLQIKKKNTFEHIYKVTTNIQKVSDHPCERNEQSVSSQQRRGERQHFPSDHLVLGYKMGTAAREKRKQNAIRQYKNYTKCLI